MVKVEHVSKSFNSFSLKEISFELKKGYIMGLIGPNGSGKTTLIHLLIRLYKLDSGDIFIDGMNTKDAHYFEEIHDKIGVVLQERLFSGYYKKIEKLALMYGKYYKTYNHNIFLDLLERFSLDKDKYYDNLSKGEELKFQLAFVMAHQPKLLILDEPTGNFDEEFRDEFFTLMKEFIADKEKSVIIATHLTDDLDRIADYILYLEKGKQVMFDDIESIKDSYRLVSGEEYKINMIDKKRIIHKEKGEFNCKALVKHAKFKKYDKEVENFRPTIEDIMYYFTKSTKEERNNWKE